MSDSKFETYYYNQEFCMNFYSLFRECAQKFGCCYMGYIYEDLKTNSRIGFTSNVVWQDVYIGDRLIDDCHLWQQIYQYLSFSDSKNFILPWSIVKPKNGKQKDIQLYREENGISQNGISFCSKTSRSREYLFFSSDKNESNFLAHVKVNMDFIKQCCSRFREATALQLYADSSISNKQWSNHSHNHKHKNPSS